MDIKINNIKKIFNNDIIVTFLPIIIHFNIEYEININNGTYESNINQINECYDHTIKIKNNKNKIIRKIGNDDNEIICKIINKCIYIFHGKIDVNENIYNGNIIATYK